MYRSALVLGLGASGAAAARLLLREGSRVTLVDRADNCELRERKAELERAGADVRLGVDRLPDTDADVCVASPGIPADSPWIRTVERCGIETISELELGARRCRLPILAVTGSNGKSTMVRFCADVMERAGRRAAPAGNYGVPLCHVVGGADALDWVVVEVSSFQLERVVRFRPRVGVLLNIQPDHLDRHGDMQTYASLKWRLFGRMAEGDTGIVPAQKADEAARLSGGRNRWIRFGEGRDADYRFREGSVRSRDGRRRVSLRGTLFDNPVLGPMAAAATAAAAACGIETGAVEEAARRFKPLPHRMQKVAEVEGVTFIDDSKATNLSALAAALRMTPGRVRLIAGGLLKEKNPEFLKDLLAMRVGKVYLIGNCAPVLEEAWRGAVDACACGTLPEAVRRAAREAERGETVLLSPGCASFDQFRNFEDRGDQFVSTVVRLKEEVAE